MPLRDASSSNTVYPETLWPHPERVPQAVRRVSARVDDSDPDWLQLSWRVDGCRDLVLPTRADSARADGLWQTTCFEAFIQREGEAAYAELNLSPSGRWNAYDFTAYRDGMAARRCTHVPTSRLTRALAASNEVDAQNANVDVLHFDATIARNDLPRGRCRLGLAAVIEERGGLKSYWALAHPAADAPDFHAAAGFVLHLEKV